MFSKKNIIRILINTLIGIILIFVWTRFINLAEVLKILKTTKLQYILIFVLLFLTSSLFRSLRLKLLLNQFKFPFKNLLFLNLLSQFLSFIIPIRAGEITKSLYLSSNYKLPLGKTVIWIFLDRFLDLWVALLVISLLLSLIKTPLPPNLQTLLLIALSLLSAGSIAAILSINTFKRFTKFLSYLLVFPKIQLWFVSFTHALIDGFLILRRHPKELFILSFLSFAAAISDAFIWFVTFQALGINLELVSTLLGSLLSALTFLIPSAPGYVGSAEASGLAVFSGVLGINPNLASAATVLNHILVLIISPFFGVTSLYFLKLNLSGILSRIFRKASSNL